MLVLAVAARFVTISHLWLDEALTVNIARLPLRAIPEALRHDGAPPFYYAVLHVWMRVFGDGELAVRSLSGVMALIAVPLAWLAGRRLGGRRAALAAGLLIASSPFAIHYATEARMYSLVTVLALCGYLLVAESLQRPRFRWLALLALTSGLLLLTHYWAMYVLAVVVAALAPRAVRGPDPDPARRVLLAMAAGCLLFVPWLPVFAYQLRHTGTPWAGTAGFRSFFDTVSEFAGGHGDTGQALNLLFWALAALAVMGRPLDRHRLELDLRTRPPAQGLALVSLGTLVVAVLACLATQGAFAARYASVAFPLFLLVVAFGTTVLGDDRRRRRVLVVATVLGLAGAAPNVWVERTNAPKVARNIEAHARAGDLVAYCPDQLGPSVSRLLSDRYVEVTFPLGGSPERVDWVDYRDRNRAARARTFARMLLDRAGPDHDIWLVWSPGYRTFGTKCQALITELTKERPSLRRVVKVSPRYFEHPALVRFHPG